VSALAHQHQRTSRQRSSRGSSSVTDETLPDRLPTNQPDGPTLRKPREIENERANERKRGLKKERRLGLEKNEGKAGKAKATKMALCTPRRCRDAGEGGGRVERGMRCRDSVREMGVHRGVNFGIKMCCSGKGM